jgi:Bacterial regulatory proteins, tetR family
MSTSAPIAEAARPGLRERKKQLTRQAIVAAAEALFEEHGYEQVTVARIADTANVSVKTLFTYFDSKEDLVFAGEDETRDEILRVISGRRPGQSVLHAMRDFLIEQTLSAPAEGLEGFHRRLGDLPALHSRLLVMFERYEQALARLLADETGKSADDPRPRMAAAQLISLLRLVTTPEARARINTSPVQDRPAAVRDWINSCADLLGEGLAHYGEGPAAPGQDCGVPAER